MPYYYRGEGHYTKIPGEISGPMSGRQETVALDTEFRSERRGGANLVKQERRDFRAEDTADGKILQ